MVHFGGAHGFLCPTLRRPLKLPRPTILVAVVCECLHFLKNKQHHSPQTSLARHSHNRVLACTPCDLLPKHKRHDSPQQLVFPRHPVNPLPFLLSEGPIALWPRRACVCAWQLYRCTQYIFFNLSNLLVAPSLKRLISKDRTRYAGVSFAYLD